MVQYQNYTFSGNSHTFCEVQFRRLSFERHPFDEAVTFSHPRVDIGLKCLKEIPPIVICKALVSFRVPSVLGRGFLRFLGTMPDIIRGMMGLPLTTDHWLRKTYNKSLWNLFTVR